MKRKKKELTLKEKLKLVFSLKGCSFCGFRKANHIVKNYKEELYLCCFHYRLYKKGYDPREDYSEADYQTWNR